MRTRSRVVLLLALVAAGCNLPSAETLLPVGTPFTVRGTLTLQDSGCPVWAADNGVTYFLYQDPLLDNASFDQVTTPGVTSRLVVATRSDLTSPCKNATVVEVKNVLEISG